MADHDSLYVSVDQLRIGLYVYIDLKWFEHPFAFNNFKIKDEAQIKTLRSLGLKKVRYDPARSDIRLAASENKASEDAAASEPEPEPISTLKEHPALAAKRALIEKIRLQRLNTARIEQAFVDTARTVAGIEKNLLSNPEETVRQATLLVSQIADSLLTSPEIAIHVMSERVGGEEMYFHSLNVAMLSMMVARDLKLPAEVVNLLGMGAMFHDIGTTDVPDKILMKREPWTMAEQKVYEMHCQYGVDLGKILKLSPAALAVIQQHHELFDGTGYPQKLKNEAINGLARIVSLTNFYDKLCNPRDINKALTPHEALSMMFAKLRSKFDPKLLQVLVRCLGVYPPGSIVQLSNGVIGIVTTVNTAKPMKPMVLTYDADIPKEEAILVDMELETDVNIAKAIRPAQLPRAIFNYLSPRKQVSYFFDATSVGQEAVSA